MMRGVRPIVAAVVVCAGCDSGRETTLVVRTTLPAELRSVVEESFEARHPDVDLRFSDGEARASLQELEADGGPPFDVWWGATGEVLDRAGASGHLDGYEPRWPERSREPAPDDLWHVTLVTPFVIAFNREELTLTRAPRDWVDTFHHRWAEEIWALDPSQSEEGAVFVGSMLVEALRDDDDLNRGFDWLDRLDTQVERYASNSSDIVHALQQREALLGILPRATAEEARASGDEWLYYRLPESGTPTLELGVAIMRGTPARDAAARFVDHLGETGVATEAKRLTRWEPVSGAVDRDALPRDFEVAQSWAGFPIATDTLRAELEGWVSRWNLEVRGVGK
ncbi:MAG: extracellular solute-binding protein [Gemmatimonadota bacterium]